METILNDSIINIEEDTTVIDESLAGNEENIEGDITCLSGSLLGVKRKCLEEIYDIYCKHASEVGFSVRKSTSRYNADKVLVIKVFVCSNQGLRQGLGTSSSKNYITRTECKAFLKAKLVEDGFFEIVEHCMDHNHTLCRKELSFMHRSNRSISSEMGALIEDLITSGIRPIDSYRYMKHDAGGEQMLGHTVVDHLNFVNRLKMAAIEGCDAQSLIDNLYQQSAKDPGFFFRVKMDDEGRLCNIFWRDSMMKEDYEIFGDVVVFDTTYRTNRYNLICAPFVGINNHWKNVMFGCAFISNEKIESFEWLFDVFKKSMGGKSPISLFTDQDLAISSAIGTVFPTTRHRLCIWHLNQNAINRFGSLKSDKSFKDAFQKCLSGCNDPEEFENCWSAMISNYDMQNNSWFERLYELRFKWCTALSKEYFSAGILSSQRSESTNSTLGFKAKKTTSLTDFYRIFEMTVQNWRSAEASDEFRCSKFIPTSTLSMTGILKHASEVYTLTIFKEFEREFIKSISTIVKLLYEDGGMKFYEVIDEDGKRKQTVSFYEVIDVMVACSCKKFEECGILCYHTLRILHLHSVTEIPHRYLNRRWKKFVKQAIWDTHSDPPAQPENRRDLATWRHQLMRTYYNALVKGQNNEQARLAIEDATKDVVSVVDRFVTNPQEITPGEAMQISESSNSVLNPSHSNTKGRKKQRIKPHQKRNKGKSSDVSASKEFGTKTPNPRLI